MKCKKTRGLLALFVAFPLAFVCSPASNAQTVTATLGGRVTDTSGGVIPKAAVTAVNTATAFSRSTRTNDTGDYLLPALPVGDYTVTAETVGFRKEVKTITLQIGQVATLDFVLAVSEVTQKAVAMLMVLPKGRSCIRAG